MVRGRRRRVLGRIEAIAKWLAEIQKHPKYLGAVDVLRVLKVCRWPLATLVVVLILLFKESQGQDALLALITLHKSGWGEYARVGLFILTVGLWASLSWYLPRLRMYFWRQGNNAGDKARMLATLLPRLLGSACFLIVGAATWRARVVGSPRLVPILLVAMAPAFYLATVYRRLWLEEHEKARPRPRLTLAKLLTPAEIGVVERIGRKEALERYEAGILLMAGMGAVWALVMILLAASPVGFAQFIGAPSAALLAASFWTTVTTAVGVWSDLTRLPWAFLLVVWAFVISPLADNHVVEPRPEYVRPRSSVAGAFAQWLDGHQRIDNETVPAFFAYAEGGGIRAAYWTAAVLGELADENPEFADHLFAVSGISGGSWGATVYTGVREWIDRQNWQRPDTVSNGYGHTVTEVHAVLQHDFLSPVMAGLLIRDPFQWFLPFVHLPDRGRAFEQAWEDAWRLSLGEDALAQSFFDLRGRDLRLPHLFLGATWAEQGRPIVISDLTFESKTTSDFFEKFTREVKASTAAHLSSRFPIFNPPATIALGTAMHLVDGGYYENSGAETLVEVIDAAVNEAKQKGRHIRPVVIALHNDVDVPKQDSPPPALAFATELSAPATAALKVSSGYTRRAEDVLRRWRLQQGPEIEVLPFDLARTPTAVPLGWSLSEAAMREMDVQILHSNEAARNEVKRLLNAAAGS